MPTVLGCTQGQPGDRLSPTYHAQGAEHRDIPSRTATENRLHPDTARSGQELPLAEPTANLITCRLAFHLAPDPQLGADIIIHDAAWYEIGVDRKARELMHAINVVGTDNLLSLALEQGIPRAVYVSSSVYYGDTGSQIRDETYGRQKPYALYYEQSKAEAHEIALEYQRRGLPLVIVCPANVMGPNDHAVWGYFLRMYVNRLMPPFAWAPETHNSGVHVSDVAEGIALTAE